MLARRQLISAIVLPVLLLAWTSGLLGEEQLRVFSLADDSPDVINLSAYSEFLHDPSNTLSLNDNTALARQDWLYAGDKEYLQFGMGDAIPWLRISIDNTKEQTEYRFFEITKPLIDIADIVVLNSLGEAQYQLGAMKSFAERIVPHHNLVIPLTLPPGEATTIYMRLQSTKALTFSLRLLTNEGKEQTVSQQRFITGLYLGCVVFIILFCLYQYLVYKSVDYCLLALVTIGFALFNITQIGYGHQYLWPDNQWLSDRASVLTTCSTAVFGTLFGASFLWRNGLSRFAYRSLLLIAIVNGILFFGATIVPYGAAIRLALFVAFIGLVFTAACAAIIALQKGKHTRVYLAGWVILGIGATLSVSHLLGWSPPSQLAAHGILIGAALAPLVWILALSDQYKFEAQQLLQEKEINIRQGLQRETELHRRLQGLLEENNRCELLLQKADRLDATTGLLNITAFHTEMDRAFRSALRYGHTLSVVALEVDDLNAIMDSNGQQAADNCLAAIAQVVNESMRRPGDIAGRIAGSRLGIVLPYTDIDGALEVIQGIKQGLQAWSRGENKATALSLRIGIASTENRLARHAEDLIESAMAQIPKNGEKSK